VSELDKPCPPSCRHTCLPARPPACLAACAPPTSKPCHVPACLRLPVQGAVVGVHIHQREGGPGLRVQLIA
jgi:hypothetical protein